MYIVSMMISREKCITADPLLHHSSPLEIEIAVTDSIRHKPPCSGQVPAELIQARAETLRAEIHKLVNSVSAFAKYNQRD
jgi:hypothetical protein